MVKNLREIGVSKRKHAVDIHTNCGCTISNMTGIIKSVQNKQGKSGIVQTNNKTMHKK